MHRLKVTIAVYVTVPDVIAPHLPPVSDNETAAALVDTIALRALAAEGLDPISAGYGYAPL